MAAPREAANGIPEVEGALCVPIDVSEQIEFCYARGWTDGLPVVPANRARVTEMLEAAGLEPDVVIAEMPSRKVAVTAEKVAINAIMAGCKPEYLPVVVAAVKGLAAPEFVLHHVASGLSGATIVIVVNGPIARKLGINATYNLFGPGPDVRANATIGRALRLILLNCLRYTPGVSDRATMGTPGKYTCCIAENEEGHPWEPWHVERGFRPEQSTVTLVAASTMIQVWNTGNHEQLLRTIGDALSFLGSIALLDHSPGAVVLSGEHAELLRASGWSKRRIREFVVAHACRTVADLKRAGRIDGEIRAADESTLHYAMDAPEELLLLCAGSRIGTLSMVLPGFSMEKGAGRTRPILIEAPAPQS
ncbi:MAG TPA: hypothetical protein VKF40_05360 [Burkholderiales bacterium]|nr:hypothetical protein [Burkholderiales bacterium]